jgi:hypothetical protein
MSSKQVCGLIAYFAIVQAVYFIVCGVWFPDWIHPCTTLLSTYFDQVFWFVGGVCTMRFCLKYIW